MPDLPYQISGRRDQWLRELGRLEWVHNVRQENPPSDHVQFQIPLILKEVNAEFDLSQ